MNSTELLAIPLDHPERLFAGVAKEDEILLRMLRKEWHPDRNKDPRALEVFKHIGELHRVRTNQLQNGKWRGHGEVEFPIDDKTRFVIRYHRQNRFEFGTTYITNKAVCHVFPAAHTSRYESTVAHLKALKFRDGAMEKSMSEFLPHTVVENKLTDGYVIGFQRQPDDLICLRDLHEYVGTIPPEHVAWMLTRLCNLACYLEFARITHNAITLDNLYVSPSMHTVALLGGWWYTREEDSKLSQLPRASAAVWQTLPYKITSRKRATNLLDRSCIRSIARKLLGNNAPAPMLIWSKLPCAEDALQDFQGWEHARSTSFPTRRFVKLEINARDVY